MAKVEEFARLIIKRSGISGETASLAPLSVKGTYDHTLLPAWSPTDLYIGEFYMNEPDEKLWIRLNSTTIKRVLLEGDIITTGGTFGSSGSSGTSGRDGLSGTAGTSGSSGVSGTVTGVTTHNEFYYSSGNSTLYVSEIVASDIILTGLTTVNSTNYIVADTNNKLSKTTINGDTADVIIGAITLHFVNGLYTGCDGC